MTVPMAATYLDYCSNHPQSQCKSYTEFSGLFTEVEQDKLELGKLEKC